jgi:hypothetical protein
LNNNIKIKYKNSSSSVSYKTNDNKLDTIKKEVEIEDTSKINENDINYTFNNVSLKRSNSQNVDNNKKNIISMIKNNNSSKEKKVHINNMNINKNKKKLKKISSPDAIKRLKLKLMNIPISKKKNSKNDYNSNTYDSSNSKRIQGTETLTSNTKNDITDFSDLNLINGNIDERNLNKNDTIIINNFFKNYQEKLSILSNGTNQSFCYYRVYNKNNIKINLLETNSENLEVFGYSEGYVCIDLNSDILKFIPKVEKGNEIWIYLRSIIDIKLEEYMITIKKIHEIFENGYNNNNLNIKNLIQMKEFNDIPIDQNKKIKAALCKNFAFNIIINDINEVIIECVFMNFQIYNFWIDFLEKIMEYHIKIDIINNIYIDNYKSI